MEISFGSDAHITSASPPALPHFIRMMRCSAQPSYQEIVDALQMHASKGKPEEESNMLATMVAAAGEVRRGSEVHACMHE